MSTLRDILSKPQNNSNQSNLNSGLNKSINDSSNDPSSKNHKINLTKFIKKDKPPKLLEPDNIENITDNKPKSEKTESLSWLKNIGYLKYHR